MTEQLTGVDLRKQVAMKLGYRVEQATYQAAPYTECYELLDKEGHARPNRITELYYQDTPEQCWEECCPAFESDLGALQASGVIDAVLKDPDFCSVLDTAEGMAREFARAFLSLSTKGEGA